MNKINWNYCQVNSDEILSDGVLKLLESNSVNPFNSSVAGFGNYLISHEGKPYYVGEAKDIKARLKQQFKTNTSTFYKNYGQFIKSNSAIAALPIEGFSVQSMLTEIGRKEIEDFGIVNLLTPLNKFQIGKRLKKELVKRNGLWDEVQELKMNILVEGEEVVLNQKFESWFESKPQSKAGLYIVKDNNKLIYIGESSDISERHKTHSGTTYFSALRRHIAKEILGFELKEKNGKKKYLSDTEDKGVTEFLRGTQAAFNQVSFGRYELEEYLIKKHKPLLNRKDNKGN